MHVRIIISLFLVFSVGVYAFFRAQSFLFGPDLTILSPIPYQYVSQEFTLKGFAENTAYLSINDRRMYPDEDGFFEKNLVLPTGYTIVKLYARNRQKRERIIYLPLYIQSYDTDKKNNNKENDEEVPAESDGRQE